MLSLQASDSAPAESPPPRPASSDSIVAVASGAPPAAVALLRLSGPNCRSFLQRCLPQAARRCCQQPRRLHLAELYDGPDGALLDQGLVVFFPGPRSYTGEDSLELHLHGSSYLLRRVLDLARREDFRLAAPGEFTRRAVAAGKLDLTAAESIHALVAADSEQQWLAARQLADGSLRRCIEDLRGQLLAAMASLEARIDFPEEAEVAALPQAAFWEPIAQVRRRLQQLLRSYASGRSARHGFRVVLIGAANAGKSSLLNALLERDRALVSDIAGTTRDYIEESLLLDGRLLRICDTAGLRSTADPLEQAGIAQGRRSAATADAGILLLASDGDASDLELLREARELLADRPLLLLRSKADLPAAAHLSGCRFNLELSLAGATKGLGALRARLCAWVDGCTQQLRQETCLSEARHRDAVEQALAALARLRTAAAAGAYDECLAVELQEAATALATIVGRVADDDVYDTIFARFCIGK